MTIQEFLDNGNIIEIHHESNHDLDTVKAGVKSLNGLFKEQNDYFKDFESKPDCGDTYSVILRTGQPIATFINKANLIKLINAIN